MPLWLLLGSSLRVSAPLALRRAPNASPAVAPMAADNTQAGTSWHGKQAVARTPSPHHDETLRLIFHVDLPFNQLETTRAHVLEELFATDC